MVFFFFQADDGIQNPLVAGVPTCALPICWGGWGVGWGRKKAAAALPQSEGFALPQSEGFALPQSEGLAVGLPQSVGFALALVRGVLGFGARPVRNF